MTDRTRSRQPRAVRPVLAQIMALALAVALALALATGEAHAAQHQAPAHEIDKTDKTGQAFLAMDADKSGAVSREEFLAAMQGVEHPADKPAAFARMDADANGQLTAQEWSAFMKGHGKQHGNASHY